jgi:hypothetical protein
MEDDFQSARCGDTVTPAPGVTPQTLRWSALVLSPSRLNHPSFPHAMIDPVTVPCQECGRELAADSPDCQHSNARR